MSVDTVKESSNGWRLGVFLIAALIMALVWVGLGLALFLDAPRTLTISLVAAAAIGTEGLFWLGAVLLGWSVFSNRRSIWGRLTGQKNEKTPS